MRDLTQPLSIAVRTADSIAEGRPLSVDLDSKRDIGNLLSSLKRMHNNLQLYQQKSIDYQEGLQHKVKQLADSQSSLSQSQRMASLGNWSWEIDRGSIHWSDEMNAAALEKLKLETELKYALEREEFILHYQPKIDISSGMIVGAEALIRWQHPQRGLLAPGQFIGVAEEIGLIVPMGQWVLETACRQLAAWRKEKLPNISIAVNLASASFRSESLANDVSTVLAHYKLEPEALELEVTESMLMHDAETTLTTLSKLRELGVKLSVDDIGTGHSSLSYLRRFRIDQLKIDRSFVSEITNSPGMRRSRRRFWYSAENSI